MFFFKKKINSKKTPSTSSLYSFFTFFLGVCVFFLGGYIVYALQNMQFQIFDTPTKYAPSLVESITKNLIGEKDSAPPESIFILLTGRGGGKHDGGELTDTIMLTKIDFSRQLITFLSLPRDLYVYYPNKVGHGKLNSVFGKYFYSEGIDVAEQKLQEVIKDITGKDVDYYIDVDFQGFIEIIDALGGVEVTLENNLVDYKYPNNNLGYQTFILKKGTWNLDGKVALMYARSRYSTSDFDRSMRQQQILSGLRKKVSELGYFKDRKKLFELYDILKDNISTDIPLATMVQLGLELRSWKQTQTLSANINDLCFPGIVCEKGGFLYTPPRDDFGGQSVLLPNGAYVGKYDSYEEINTFSNIVFDTPEILLSPEKISIYNASGVSGLAFKVANRLLSYGFSIDTKTDLYTLPKKDFEKSIIYYNTIDEKNVTLQSLSRILNIPIEKHNAQDFDVSKASNIQIILASSQDF